MGRRTRDLEVPPEGIARLVAARACGTSVVDLARRFDRSPAWVRTMLQQAQAPPSSSDGPVQVSA